VTPPRRLVLDTDVLFSRVHHETYGRPGVEGVVIVIWSDAILTELKRVLIEHGRSPTGELRCERWHCGTSAGAERCVADAVLGHVEKTQAKLIRAI
jgi:hypothetical protein